ncbi:MAG: single-stranded-DNA-specific exonuclease RecJ [Lachnospiraceae bacterium]|nr:single-stranded-DNA-specific exonuclease RecJ [Lachnospiraceae bacterium]
MRRTEKWVIISRPGNYVEIGKKYGISPVLARLLGNRGVTADSDIRDFLEKGTDRLFSKEYSGFCLKDMDRAVEITLNKIKEKKKIRIAGDYDIDGVSAVFILEKGLKKLGADVDHRIPHRIHDGYGLNEKIIREAHDAGTDTIITCDNGISAVQEISLAKSLGMTVIITDHHEVPFTVEGDRREEILPEADAIVDPKRQDCTCPFKDICGAYVAYKFITSLYEKAGMDRGEAEEFLEIAAFATIGDVMPLKGENRMLVREGLKRLENSSNPGLRELISLNSLEGKTMTPYHVGFILGPCVNAAGRLGDAEDSLKLLLCEDPDEIHERAVVLKEMNDSRKSLTEKGVEEALKMAETPEYENDKILVVFLQDCHESIAGIIAGKVRERTGRPAFILTEGVTSEGEACLKGSGRSIERYNMFEEMTKIKDLFIRFGGHAMAAGLSLPRENLEEMRKRLNENPSLTEEDLAVRVSIDMELPLSYVNPSLIEELQRLEPLGTGNEKPLFALRNARFSDVRIFGKNNNVLKAEIYDGTAKFDCVYFGKDAPERKKELESRKEGAKVVYSPGFNEYRGVKTIEIQIQGIK